MRADPFADPREASGAQRMCSDNRKEFDLPTLLSNSAKMIMNSVDRH